MSSESDRKHAELSAGFFSNIGVAFVAGAFLQIVLGGGQDGAGGTALLMMTGFGLYGVSHIILHRAYGER